MPDEPSARVAGRLLVGFGVLTALDHVVKRRFAILVAGVVAAASVATPFGATTTR